MRVVALFRVSTEKQATEGASLEAQERTYHEIAQREGWETVRTFHGCESATQAASDRQVLQNVLACVRSEKVDAIWVIEQSRLTRGNWLDVATLERDLTERKIKVIVRHTVRDMSSIDDSMMFGVQATFDRAESQRLKERMNRGKKQKALNGKRVSGKPPYGYRNPRPGEPGRGTLQVVPEEAAVVRRIFNWRLEGLGDRAIAAKLDDMGAPPPRGKRWGKSTVGRILNCVAYAGVAASNVWIKQGDTRGFKLDLANPQAILVENAHEAIVERAVWDAARSVKKRPCANKPRLLVGLLHVNGEPYAGDTSGGTQFYRGPRGMRNLPWLETQAVDDTVWDAFAQLATGEEFVARLVREAQKSQQMAISQAEIVYLEGEIEKRRKRLERLIDMRQEGEIDSQQLRERSFKAREEMNNLQSQLADERAKASMVDRTQIERLVKTVQMLIAGRRRLTLEQKRQVLRSIVVRIDATAVPTGAVQQRVEGGRLSGTGGPRWRVESVRFRLAVPGEESPTRAYSQTGGVLAQAGERADEQAADDRVGQLATTCSCSAPRGRARP